MATAVKRRCVSSCPFTVEKSAKRLKPTYFSDDHLYRLKQVFEEDKFPNFDRKGKDKNHVWSQLKGRSRLRKRKIRNKPAPVTSPAQPSSKPCYQSNFVLPTCGTAHVPTCKNIWRINKHDSSPEFPAINTVGSSAFMNPSFRFTFAPTSLPPSLPVMTAEEKSVSHKRENYHSSDQHLAAAMGLLSIFNREN